MKVAEILRHFEAKAPAATAERWDNVGLLVGDPETETRGAVICIDLNRSALDAAKKTGAKVIVNHHPCIFPKDRGLGSITAAGPALSPLIFEAIREGICVVAIHTNFDQCALEVSQAISKGLGIEPRGRLHDSSSDSLTKLVVFVPKTHLEAVREAICEAGAGHIGNYDFCTFGTTGTGTFRGGEGTDPFIGKAGKLEQADEIRLETILPRGLERTVLKSMLKAHPYEEVAYDLYPVRQAPIGHGLSSGLGYGVWGDFPEAKSFSDLTQHVKRLFDSTGFWVTEPPPKMVKRVGFVAGKGASFIPAAARMGCDVFITGEAGYHSALDGARRGLAVIELGHRESEKFFPPTVAGWVRELGLTAEELDVPMQKIWK